MLSLVFRFGFNGSLSLLDFFPRGLKQMEDKGTVYFLFLLVVVHSRSHDSLLLVDIFHRALPVATGVCVFEGIPLRLV